jgi:hypothetical protein
MIATLSTGPTEEQTFYFGAFMAIKNVVEKDKDKLLKRSLH